MTIKQFSPWIRLIANKPEFKTRSAKSSPSTRGSHWNRQRQTFSPQTWGKKLCVSDANSLGVFSCNTGSSFTILLFQIRSDFEEEADILYSLQGIGANQFPFHRFIVDARSGQIRVTEILDREEFSVYNVSDPRCFLFCFTALLLWHRSLCYLLYINVTSYLCDMFWFCCFSCQVLLHIPMAHMQRRKLTFKSRF